MSSEKKVTVTGKKIPRSVRGSLHERAPHSRRSREASNHRFDNAASSIVKIM